MPIILHLDRVMADRKMTLNELADRVGITNVNMSRIKTGKVRAIRFSTLDAICEVLDCQPGDILRHISIDKSRNFSSDAGGSIIVDDTLADEGSGGGL